MGNPTPNRTTLCDPLGIDDTYKDVPLMQDVETLLRTVYSTFSCSTVKRHKMDDLARILDEDTLSFSLLSAMAATAPSCECCSEGLLCLKNNAVENPVANYCYQKFRKLKFKVTLTALRDVLDELAHLFLFFLKTQPNATMERHCFARAKIDALHSQ